MDHLKEGIGLRGYGQKDPLVEYKKESYHLFQDLMGRIEDETVRYLYFLRFERGAPDLPFPTDDSDFEESDDPEVEAARLLQLAEAAQRQKAAQEAAQLSATDMTRSIQRKKERELAELQFVGGDSSTATKTVVKGKKVGRNEPCPCGSGKKYKNCHGTAS
jgi:preprotein translocase subunit SecA